jgi:hypothetical protein
MEANKNSEIPMYIKQLIVTEDAVIMMPGIVLRQPLTSMIEDGHSKYIISLCPILRTPATPNQKRHRTIKQVTNPTIPPRSAARLMVKPLLCRFIAIETPSAYYLLRSIHSRRACAMCEVLARENTFDS